MMTSRFRFILALSLSVLLFACARSGESPDVSRESDGSRKAPDTASLQVAPAAPAAPAAPSPTLAEPPEPQAEARPAEGEVEGEDPAPEMPLPEEQRSPDQPMAPETAEPPSDESTPRAGSPRVYSNKDLEKYRKMRRQLGFQDNAIQVDVSDQTRGTTVTSQDDTGGPGDEEMLPEEMDREIEASRAKVNALTQELDHLKKREASLHNPFLPRPQLSDEDKLAEAGMDNVERLDRVRNRMAEIEQEIHTLRNRMAELSQSRAADSSQPR